jgi:hypothetical protein
MEFVLSLNLSAFYPRAIYYNGEGCPSSLFSLCLPASGERINILGSMADEPVVADDGSRG